MAKFVIGDIHGGFKALKQVLERANFNYDSDILISLGDLMDGWSESHLVIEELMKIKHLILIRGNHDEWALKGLTTHFDREFKEQDNWKNSDTVKKWLDYNFFTSLSGEGEAWLYHGGRATLNAYKENISLLLKHLEFLNKALPYHIDYPENRLFVHAGIIPNLTVDETIEISERELWWNRAFWQQAWAGQNPNKYYGKVYIGHTPTIMFSSHKEDLTKPVKRMNVINIDTGAAFSGKLSMINLETDELFQSDIVMSLYPDEYGRNDFFLTLK